MFRDEARSSIAYHNPWHPKPWENNFLKQFHNNLYIIGRGGNGLNPFGHIINRNQYVMISKRRRKWPHEINTPNIENFYFKDVVQGHLISFSNIIDALTLVTFRNKEMHVFKEWWPPETRLKDFERSLLSTGVATIGRRVTMVQNVTYLVFRDASSEDSIRAPFEEVRCWNKGCLTSHLLSFDNNKVLKIINWIC